MILPPAIQVCVFHWLTGRSCPLCGLTRALFALVQGRWAEALDFHPLAPLAVLMLATSFWDSAWRLRVWRAGLAAFGIYGVWRILAGH